MFRQLESVLIAIQIIAMALVLLACAAASVGAALICIIFTGRTHDTRVKGQAPQGGQSTGRLGRSVQDQG